MMKRFKTGVFCASFLVSFLLLVEGAFADIQMTTQLIDPQGAKGRINARIQQAYPNVDVYVGMITATGALYCLRGDESGSHWDWETGVHPLMQGVSLTPTDWLTLQPLDLSQVMGRIRLSPKTGSVQRWRISSLTHLSACPGKPFSLQRRPLAPFSPP
jgi:hypothetical protein